MVLRAVFESVLPFFHAFAFERGGFRSWQGLMVVRSSRFCLSLIFSVCMWLVGGFYRKVVGG